MQNQCLLIFLQYSTLNHTPNTRVHLIFKTFLIVTDFHAFLAEFFFQTAIRICTDMYFMHGAKQRVFHSLHTNDFIVTTCITRDY